MLSKDALKIIHELATLKITHVTQFPSTYVLIDAIKDKGLSLRYLEDSRLWFIKNDDESTKSDTAIYKNQDGSIGTITLDLYGDSDSVFNPVIAVCENVSDISFWTYTFTHGGLFTLATKRIIDLALAKHQKDKDTALDIILDDVPCVPKVLKSTIVHILERYIKYLDKKNISAMIL